MGVPVAIRLTVLPTPAFPALLARAAWGKGHYQLLGIGGNRKDQGGRGRGCFLCWATAPGPAHLLLSPLASQATLTAPDPGLIQAHGVAGLGGLASAARDRPQRHQEDAPDPVMNSNSPPGLQQLPQQLSLAVTLCPFSGAAFPSQKSPSSLLSTFLSEPCLPSLWAPNQ